jgi:hypothetical protein
MENATHGPGPPSHRRETEWTKQVKAVVNGVGAGQYGVLSLGPSNELFVGGESTNPVTFSDVPDGALDFVAARLATPIAGATA